MQITESDLYQIARTIWSSVLGDVEVSPSSPGLAPPESKTGVAEITGRWEGVVRLTCSSALLNESASAMFQVGLDDLSPEQVEDALSELTNITAGNIKALVEEPAVLSLPSVGPESAFGPRLQDYHSIAQLHATFGDHKLVVDVLQRNPTPDHLPARTGG